MKMIASAAEIAWSMIQKVSALRLSPAPGGVAKSARAKSPAAGRISALVTSMTAERPSALSAMPSGGATPATT